MFNTTDVWVYSYKSERRIKKKDRWYQFDKNNEEILKTHEI